MSFGELASEVMYFYSISFEELKDIPFATINFLYRRIENIRARNTLDMVHANIIGKMEQKKMKAEIKNLERLAFGKTSENVIKIHKGAQIPGIGIRM